jgi:hypothetical protein
MPSFKLANPVLMGDIQTTVSASNAENAAKELWDNISKHVAMTVSRFGFSVKQEGGKLYHFMVEESQDGKKVNYKIKKLDLKLKPKQEKELEKKADELSRQVGGKDKSEKDSSSSSSDEKLYKQMKKYGALGHPITYWWYTPYLYNYVGYSSVFIPNFVLPLTPYVEIDISSAFWG